MSKIPAQLLALALTMHNAEAITCASGWTAQTTTGVNNEYCLSNAESCKMSPKCCKAPTPAATCASSVASIKCDAGKYNKADTTAAGTDGKAACCIDVATCADHTCPAGYQAESGKSAEKCPSSAASCKKSTCCKLIDNSCEAWRVAGNTCGDDKTWIANMGSTGTGDMSVTCCREKTFCSSVTCPSATHEAVASAQTKECGTNSLACDASNCCQCKATTCCGAAHVCTGNTYLDPSKSGAQFGTDKQAACCSNKAQCKDSPAIAETSAAKVPAPVFFIVASILVYTAAK